MDFRILLWDKSNMEKKRLAIARQVPTFDLYGEQGAQRPDFWVHCETIAARSSTYQWEIGLHRHERLFQLLYIRNGAGDALFGGRAVTLAPPCIVVMPPGISHGYRFSRDVEGFVITVVVDQLRLIAELHKRPQDWLAAPQVLSPEGEDGGYIDATIVRIAEEFEARRTGRNDLIDAYITTVLMLIGRRAAPQLSDVGKDARQLRVETLKELIGRHFREHLPAAHYAQLLNLSPTHLNRIVRDVTGVSVHDLIMARIIDEARRALVFTPSSIQQIADNLGFSDAAYFSRCFRNRTGQTPGAFRRNERQKLSAA